MSRYRVRNLFKFRTKSTTDLSEWNKNDEKLLKTVEVGDVKKATSVLNKKTLNPTKLGPKGHSVLHIACAVGNDQIVELLLKYSEDVNDLTIQGNTALQLAAAKGHSRVVHRLLAAGADVDMRDSNDMTALHHTCAGVHFECVQVLLNGNANPRIKEKTGKTPLFFASHRGDMATCKWLVDKGADVNAQDMHRMTSLMLAAKEGHAEVCQFLLKKGADPDQRDVEGNNALAYALNSGHNDMKEVFARAPTRASWDVHANNATSSHEPPGDAATSPVPEPAPVPLAPHQIDIVGDFDASESPAASRREVQTDYETDDEGIKDPLRKTQSESWDARGLPGDQDSLTDLKQMADQKTLLAFKELEEEHEQLNEDYHNLTVENRKLYDKIDALKSRMAAMAQQGQTEIPQEIEDELNNLKNILRKEQEKNQELVDQNQNLTLHNQSLSEENQVLSVQNQTLSNHNVSREGDSITRDDESVPGDSWGDSDEEPFDSPTRRRRNRSSPDDKQMLALLRSQILTLTQENDQLKDKMQSLPNGYREPSPYLFQTKSEPGEMKQDQQINELQQAVLRLEAEKADMQKEILVFKEKSEFQLLNGAINQEELIVENKRLSKELEDMKNGEEVKLEPKLEPQLESQSETRIQNDQNGDSPQPKEKEDGQIEEKERSSVKEEDHSRIEFLENQNVQLQDQCAVLNDELEKLRETFDAILKAGDDLQSDFDQLQTDKEQLQIEFERVLQEKDELVKENEFLLSDGNALHEDLKKLVHELEKMQEKYKKVVKENEDLERKTCAINLSGKVGEFTKLLEERDKLVVKNEELEATSSRLQHDQEILLEEVQSMQEQIKIMETERDQLQAEVEEIEGVLQQHDILQQDYSQLEQDYTELLKDKEKLEQDLMDSQTENIRIDEAPEDHAKLVKENEAVIAERDQLQKTVSELCKANTTLEEDLKLVNTELKQVQKDLEQVQAELVHSKERLESASLTNGETETKKQVVKSESDSKPERSLKIKSLQTQISHLQQQLAEFDRQHQDIVSVYRTHLISAVQGHMDPDVKQALHQIIELRSMEQFC
ncbi:ankycorbin-like [Haliotis asinina]|uniref:ankycorbin-like n=1 Tax=Haliotis asinina TaxID=109174 RepID=UPI003531F1FB